MTYINKIRAIQDKILATKLEMGERKTSAGIIISDDNMKGHGIRPRWCQVYSIGPRCIYKDDIEEGDWILVHHGRWTVGIKLNDEYIWQIDPDGILLHSVDEPTEKNTIGNPSDGLL